MLKNIKNFFGRSKTPSERYKERYYEKKDNITTTRTHTIEETVVFKPKYKKSELDCQNDDCTYPLCGCESARKGYN